MNYKQNFFFWAGIILSLVSISLLFYDYFIQGLLGLILGLFLAVFNCEDSKETKSVEVKE